MLFFVSGSYIAVRSDIGHVGDQVTLWSPTETFKRGSVVKFQYHMRISDEDTTAALTVYTYSSMHVYERRLIEIRGNRGVHWQTESVCLPEGTYQLAFVATHGRMFMSDIALKEIVVTSDKERCDSSVHNADSHRGKYFANTTSSSQSNCR